MLAEATLSFDVSCRGMICGGWKKKRFLSPAREILETMNRKSL